MSKQAVSIDQAPDIFQKFYQGIKELVSFSGCN